jgi:hypothetical protein
MAHSVDGCKGSYQDIPPTSNQSRGNTCVIRTSPGCTILGPLTEMDGQWTTPSPPEEIDEPSGQQSKAEHTWRFRAISDQMRGSPADMVFPPDGTGQPSMRRSVFLASDSVSDLCWQNLTLLAPFVTRQP